MSNPFAPTFGATPPVFAGRDDILMDIADALEAGTTHPDYTTLLIGVRGAGKTAMLNVVEDLATEQGWLTISEHASPAGLPDRLFRAAALLLGEMQAESARRVSSLTVAGFGIGFDSDDQDAPAPDLRAVLTSLGNQLSSSRTGLLITIDEVQSGDLDELREFGTVLQHVTRREGLPIAFVGAALPQLEETLLADEAVTFLQRCSRYDIDRLSMDATRRAIAEPLELCGSAINPEALDLAVAATSGYAFMVQLVGFHSWKAAADPLSLITLDAVTAGVSEAEQRIGRLVLEPTWRRLSPVDRRFLVAMACDDGESHLAEIARRLDVEIKYAGVYRKRLIKAGMIISKSRGVVDFAHNATRRWLRDQHSE